MSRKALESRDVSVETAAGPEALAFYGNKLVILDQEVVILDKCFSLKLELRHGNLHFHPMDYLEFIARTKSPPMISDNHYSRLTTIKIPVSRVYYPGSFGRRSGWFKIVKSGNCTC
jgi:hypothetical protein